MSRPPLVPLFPEQASTVAPRVDALYVFLVVLGGAISILIAGLLLVFAVKYRRGKPGDRSPEHAPHPVSHRTQLTLEVLWIGVPFVVGMGIFWWGASIYASMARPPAHAAEIFVVGQQWMWKVQHMSGQREINELHVPVGRPVKLTMTSEDVIHSFFVPAFRVKADALPGRYTTVWFEPTKAGSYHLFCTEYCGTKHSAMIGRVVVMEPAAYQTWLGREGEGSLASAGNKLFQDLGCDTCHRADATGRGPNLEGLFGGGVELQGGDRVTADEAYLRESILDPKAKITAGFQPIMPSYQGMVTEEGIIQLVAYIRSLSRPRAAGDRAPSGAPAKEEAP